MRPRQFDDQQVIDVALGLLDTGGPGALSVRSVASALNVNPNAVYTYVSDRADLEAAIAERVLGMADLSALDGPPSRWRQRIERFCLSAREVLLEHPGAVPLLMRVPLQGPVALAIGEGLLQAYRDAGLSNPDAARATYAVIVHLLGSAALDVAETPGTAPLEPETQRVAARRAAFDAAPLDDFPLTAAAVPTMATWVSQKRFRRSLGRLLDGVVGS